MLSREEPTAGEVVHGGPGVPAGNEHSLLLATVRLPADSDPVRGGLPRDAAEVRNESRANRVQADQADSGDGVALMKLRAKARWKLGLHDARLNPEVHEYASPNHALDDRQSHAQSPISGCRTRGGRPHSTVAPGWW